MTQACEYTTFLELVNRLSERRQAVTATYLSVNAALIGAVAFLFPGQQVAVLVLFGAGILARDLWRRILSQYHDLLEGWYAQLHLLEAQLPDSSDLITKEYEMLYAPQPGRRPLGLSGYERRLTWIFSGAYGLFALVVVAGWVLEWIGRIR